MGAFFENKLRVLRDLFDIIFSILLGYLPRVRPVLGFFGGVSCLTLLGSGPVFQRDVETAGLALGVLLVTADRNFGVIFIQGICFLGRVLISELGISGLEEPVVVVVLGETLLNHHADNLVIGFWFLGILGERVMDVLLESVSECFLRSLLLVGEYEVILVRVLGVLRVGGILIVDRACELVGLKLDYVCFEFSRAVLV